METKFPKRDIYQPLTIQLLGYLHSESNRPAVGLELPAASGVLQESLLSADHFEAFNGISWDLVGFHGISWAMGFNFMEFHGIS